MATNTQKLSLSLRKKLNDALALNRTKAQTFHGKVEGVDGLKAGQHHGTVSRQYVKEQLAGGLPVRLTAIRDEAEQNAAAAQAAYEDAYRRASTISSETDATKALLDETRAAKAWARIERELSVKNASTADVISTALKDGDRLTRAVVLTEFPSWAKANGSKVSLETYAGELIPELAEVRKEVNDALNYRLIVDSNIGKIDRAVERNFTDPIASVDDIGNTGASSYLDPDVAIYG